MNKVLTSITQGKYAEMIEGKWVLKQFPSSTAVGRWYRFFKEITSGTYKTGDKAWSLSEQVEW